MRNLFFTAVAAMALLSPAFAQDPAILQKEAELRQAILDENWSRLHELYGNDVLCTWYDGRHDDLEDMKNTMNNHFDATAIEVEDVQVRSYNGDTAIVTGIWNIQGTLHDRKIFAPRRFTHVWVKVGGQWKLVSRHHTGLH